MQPWKISVGLGVAIAGVAVAYLGKRFAFLGPYAGLIRDEYWWPVTFHFLAAVLTLMALMAAVLRSLGLVDVGRKLDLMERSTRRGAGDQDLARRLHEEAEGTFTE